MRVGFDTSPLHRPHPPGVVRVVEHCLAALEARDVLEVVRLDPPSGVKLPRWRHRVLPREVRARDLAGLHSFVSAFPLRGPGERVHTVHELPWKHGVGENADLRHKLWAGLATRRASATIVPTHFVAKDLGRKLDADGGKVHVVPWGIESRFTEEPDPGVVDEALLGRYRLPEGPFALCLGAVRAKKNLAALLHGAKKLRERGGPPLHIVVTGPDTPDLRADLGLVARLGLSQFVSTPGSVEDEDLPGLLRLAAVVPVLSSSEGFGLPVLEALACGTPVVVAQGTAQAEVAGKDGISVDADDPDAVANGLERAVTEREALRYVLPERAREFTWDKTAEAIESVWKKIT